MLPKNQEVEFGLTTTPCLKKSKKNKRRVNRTQGDDEKPIAIAITDVQSGAEFSYQIINNETEALDELSKSLQKENFAEAGEYSPTEKQEYIAAHFSVDDLWYRAQVIRIIHEDEEEPLWEIRYVDYGNKEIVKSDRIRPLPREYLDLIAPQGHCGKLWYTKAPKFSSDFGQDSAAYFKELVWGKQLTAQIVYQSKDGVNHLLVRDENRNLINAELLENGLALLQKKKKNEPNDNDYKVMLAAQETARGARLNMWQYGEAPDSEEDEAF